MSHDNEVTAKVNKYLHAAPKLALVMDPQSTITINRNKICTKYIYSNTNTRYALWYGKRMFLLNIVSYPEICICQWNKMFFTLSGARMDHWSTSQGKVARLQDIQSSCHGRN